MQHPSTKAKQLEWQKKGIVLLENDGILPLKENAQKILITGFNADNKLAYLGNYFGDPSHFVMVTEAVSQCNIDTEFIRGIHLYNQSTKHDKETALKSAAESDIIIMCTGLDSSIEAKKPVVHLQEAAAISVNRVTAKHWSYRLINRNILRNCSIQAKR